MINIIQESRTKVLKRRETILKKFIIVEWMNNSSHIAIIYRTLISKGCARVRHLMDGYDKLETMLIKQKLITTSKFIKL